MKYTQCCGAEHPRCFLRAQSMLPRRRCRNKGEKSKNRRCGVQMRCHLKLCQPIAPACRCLQAIVNFEPALGQNQRNEDAHINEASMLTCIVIWLTASSNSRQMLTLKHPSISSFSTNANAGRGLLFTMLLSM